MRFRVRKPRYIYTDFIVVRPLATNYPYIKGLTQEEIDKAIKELEEDLKNSRSDVRRDIRKMFKDAPGGEYETWIHLWIGKHEIDWETYQKVMSHYITKEEVKEIAKTKKYAFAIPVKVKFKKVMLPFP